MHLYRWEVELLKGALWIRTQASWSSTYWTCISQSRRRVTGADDTMGFLHGFVPTGCCISSILRKEKSWAGWCASKPCNPPTLSLLSSYNIHPGDWPQMPTVFPEHTCSSPWIKLKVEDSVPLQKLSLVLRKHKQQAREQVECILLQLPPWSFAEFPLHLLMVDLSSVFTEPVSSIPPGGEQLFQKSSTAGWATHGAEAACIYLAGNWRDPLYPYRDVWWVPCVPTFWERPCWNDVLLFISMQLNYYCSKFIRCMLRATCVGFLGTGGSRVQKLQMQL